MKHEGEKSVSEIMMDMIAQAWGNRHDICHFLKVYGYAKTIAELEKVPPEVQKTVEIAAIVHDIACPLCREKYGNTNGKLQEKESGPLVDAFLEDSGLPEEIRRRVSYLVARHHTIEGVDSLDWQILLEADYLVNADESGYPPENVRNAEKVLFRTDAGRLLLKAIYQQP